MQRLEGLMRKAIQEYGMIAPGDRVCVGVSGGKDSVALTVGLARLREYLGIPLRGGGREPGPPVREHSHGLLAAGTAVRGV